MNSSVYLDHFHFSKYSTHLNGASIETSDSQILILSNMTYVTLKAMKIRSQGIYWMSICCVILLTEYVYQCRWKKMWPESELNPRLMQRVRQFQRTRRHFRHWGGGALWGSPCPWTDWQTDRHDWKHYLRHFTSYAQEISTLSTITLK